MIMGVDVGVGMSAVWLVWGGSDLFSLLALIALVALASITLYGLFDLALLHSRRG